MADCSPRLFKFVTLFISSLESVSLTANFHDVKMMEAVNGLLVVLSNEKITCIFLRGRGLTGRF